MPFSSSQYQVVVELYFLPLSYKTSKQINYLPLSYQLPSPHLLIFLKLPNSQTPRQADWNITSKMTTTPKELRSIQVTERTFSKHAALGLAFVVGVFMLNIGNVVNPSGRYSILLKSRDGSSLLDRRLQGKGGGGGGGNNDGEDPKSKSKSGGDDMFLFDRRLQGKGGGGGGGDNDGEDPKSKSKSGGDDVFVLHLA